MRGFSKFFAISGCGTYFKIKLRRNRCDQDNLRSEIWNFQH